MSEEDHIIKHLAKHLKYVATHTSDESPAEIIKIEKALKELTEQDIERAKLIDFLKVKLSQEHTNWKDNFFKKNDHGKQEANQAIKKYTKIIELLQDNNKMKMMTGEEFDDQQSRLREYLVGLYGEGEN